ncbi:MFS family permease [Saccharothrix ecbatanensis]|uniref:MFS family permease n=1 Tax=Saccharothrix ecbatanensis TaxID=1105145 RepID=A0A7W9HK76_9PSEU|nr:MFS transporter [Saccharothrix ecbatanensis]MBB5803453.1 MFS family permease [Saccharothrix ecbatanensis]
MPDAPTAAPSGLLRDRDFVKFWSGETVSLVGAQVSELSLMLVAVVTLQASAFEIGLFNVARFTPYAALSLFVGVWFDRHRRKPVLVASNLCRAALIAVVPLAAVGGILTMELIYVVALLLGLLTVMFDVGSLSYVPGLVERRHLAEANSKIQISYSIAGIGGPGLAGLLIGVLTAPIALVITTFSYLVSAVTLVSIRKPEPPPAVPAEKTPVLTSIGEGLRAVFGNRILRNLATQSATFNLFENVVVTLFAIYAVRELGLNSAQLGLVIGAGAIGALIGAVLTPRVTRRLRLGRTLAVTTLVACTSPFLLLIATGTQPWSLAVLAVGLGLHGATLAMFNVNALTLRQSVTPSGLLGRMNASYRLLLFGTIPLGALLGGVLASAFGLRLGLTIGVVGLALPTIWLLFSPVFALPAIPDSPPEDENPIDKQPPVRDSEPDGTVRKDREDGHVV